MTSTVPVFAAQRVAATLQAIDTIEQERNETDALITITWHELEELKNKQDWTDHILNNLLCISGGKPVSCMAMQAP